MNAEPDSSSMDKRWMSWDDFALPDLLAMCVDKVPDRKGKDPAQGGSDTANPPGAEPSTTIIDLSSLSAQELELAYSKGNLHAGKLLFNMRDTFHNLFTLPDGYEILEWTVLRDWF